MCDYVGPMRQRWSAYVVTLIVCTGGCVTIPAGQYGITDIGWTGMREMSDEALEACLVTREREATVLRLGLGAGKCGAPPFDSFPPKVTLWTLPWTEWPVYDPAIFDVDKERIVRWYRARGFYDARVLGLRTYVDGRMVADPIECDASKSSCKLELMVQVEEGQPVHVKDVRIEGKTSIGAELVEKIRAALEVTQNERFDEHDYETDKQAILERLWDASFARAKVTGRVTIDPDAHTADVVYELEPGPACTFGELRVEGADDIPTGLVVLAADIREGKPYSHEAVLDAETAIFSLGAFSSVQIKPQGEGSRVDLVADVRVGRLERWSAGIGLMSGTLQRSLELSSVPQWDVHLSGAYENRNLFGGLRRFRIEERPRLIFLDEFPGAKGGPRAGNLITVRFEQPAAFERRTTFFIESAWDFGPDPFEGFFRHDLNAKVGFTRPFFRQRVSTELAIAHDLYAITSTKEVPDDVSSYRLPYFEQQIIVDLRNDRARPRYGAYAAVLVQEAFRLGGYGSWNYIRVTPDFRGYVPLMWDFVLAARFAIGATFISSAAGDLDETSARVGPTPYRLRGGGANSNRGWGAGKLGAGTDGGIRRYEASLELRIPLGQDLGVVFFGDAGDVSQGERIRFDHANIAVGFGLRYFTILGAIRFDAGWRVPGLQRLGDGADSANDVKVKVLPSQAFLTIGEAF